MSKLVCSFALLALLTPATVWAASKTYEKSFTVTEPVQVQGVTLSPGDYQVSWSEMGSRVPVTILKDHKPILKVPSASVVSQQSPYGNGALELTKEPNGKQELTKIDFAKVAVVLPTSGSAS